MRILSFLIIAGFILGACNKDVKLKLDTVHNPQLFVESILFPDEYPKVYLSNSLSFFSDQVTPQEVFVRDAEVFLYDGEQEHQLHHDSTFDKFRCRWNPYYTSNFLIKSNTTYTLRVLQEGNQLNAETVTNSSKVNIDSVEYIAEFFDIYGGHDGVILRFNDASGTGDHYRFQMDRWIDTSRYHAHILDVIKVDCVEENELFFVSDIGRSIFSDHKVDGSYLELFVEVSFEYREGDTATIYLQNLNEQAASFYHDLDEQLQSILNPFVEPAFVHSTIEGGFGVFGSGIKSDPILFIYPRDNP